MKALSILALIALLACRAAPASEAPRLAEPSGLEEVSILAKGLE